MKSLSFGIKEIRDLLKLALTCATPLTGMIIKKSAVTNPEPGILLHHNQREDVKSRKMVLKVCLQKSTNKFLFAEATDEFVELLFSFLTVPLGGVEFLLGGETGLKNIDNLYRSVSNGFENKCFITPESKNRLINPKLPHGYISKSQFLPLCEEAPPKLYYVPRRVNELSQPYEYLYYEKGGMLVSWFKSIKEYYVKKQTMCFVSDDLTVSPSLASSISILNGLGIPLSDVEETELHIGLGEALNILKASLSSKNAIADGLIKPMLYKLPKLEHQLKQEC